MPDRSGIITLTTDFGLADGYVSAMKGAILSFFPDVRFVDVAHDIPAQDIMHAAYVLRDSVPFFPEGTVHLAVVDPGVGGARRAVAVEHKGQFFVGPDNGLFSLVLETRPAMVVELDDPSAWRTPDPSPTFHGRDLFGPVAARIAAGQGIESLGSRIEALRPLHWALPIHDDQGIRGWVLHVDRFGNCITNIRRADFESGMGARRFKCYAGPVILDAVSPTYEAVSNGDPALLFNSSGLLEVAVSCGNAAELYSLRTGSPINIVYLDGQAASN